MASRVFKFIPYCVFEADLLKFWLEEMAAQGLFFEQSYLGLAQFRKDTPRKTWYYVETLSPLDLENRKEILGKNSWSYVGPMMKKSQVFQTDKKGAMIPADTEKLRKDGLHEAGMTSVFSVLMVLIAYIIIFASFKSLQYTGHTPVAAYILAVIAAVSTLTFVIIQHRSATAFKNRVYSGTVINKKSTAKQYYSSTRGPVRTLSLLVSFLSIVGLAITTAL